MPYSIARSTVRNTKHQTNYYSIRATMSFVGNKQDAQPCRTTSSHITVHLPLVFRVRFSLLHCTPETAKGKSLHNDFSHQMYQPPRCCVDRHRPLSRVFVWVATP